MSKRKKIIEEFFSKYESNFNEAIHGDENKAGDFIQQSFGPCFVESSPVGVVCGQNNKEFITKVKKGFEFYKNIGSTGMSITSKDITLIDDLHASAKVYWRYTYNKDGREESMDFHNVYLFTTTDGELKIFAYITGDEQKALRERGLVPQEAEAS